MGQRLFSLKSPESESSTAIILSFDAKWIPALETRSIDIVFRKMGPKRFEPSIMYAYMAKPISAIVARINLARIYSIDVGDAAALADRAGLSEMELKDYAAEYSQLLVYEIAQIHMASQVIAFDTLRDKFNFWPSSNYIPLSTEGIDTFDKLGDFTVDESRPD